MDVAESLQGAYIQYRIRPNYHQYNLELFFNDYIGVYDILIIEQQTAKSNNRRINGEPFKFQHYV